MGGIFKKFGGVFYREGWGSTDFSKVTPRLLFLLLSSWYLEKMKIDSNQEFPFVLSLLKKFSSCYLFLKLNKSTCGAFASVNKNKKNVNHPIPQLNLSNRAMFAWGKTRPYKRIKVYAFVSEASAAVATSCNLGEFKEHLFLHGLVVLSEFPVKCRL